MILQFFVAAAATLSFSILFHTPPKHYLICGVIGGVSWVVYLGVLRLGASALTATFAATLMLMLLGRFTSVRRRTPVSMFLTAGIFPLVPGTGIYYTAYHLFAGDLSQAGRTGIETLTTAGAIALGVLFGSAVPQIVFDRLAGGPAGAKRP